MLRKIAGLLVLGIGTMLVGNVAGQEFQEVPPEPGYLPGPLGHPHKEGDIYFVGGGGGFVYMYQVIPVFGIQNKVSSIIGYLLGPLPYLDVSVFFLPGEYLENKPFRGIENRNGSVY